MKQYALLDSEFKLDMLEADSIKISQHATTKKNTTSHDPLLRIKDLVCTLLALEEFNKFIFNDKAVTWKLWSNSVIMDCFNYVCFFIAMRNHTGIQVLSLEVIALLYAAYNYPCFQKLVSNELANIEIYESEILNCFRSGGFMVKVNGGL